MTDETAGRAPSDGGSKSANGLEALTDEVLPALIARLRASRLGELEVRTGDWRVRLRRATGATARTGAQPHPLAEGDDQPGLGISVARSTAVGYFTPSGDLVMGHTVQAGDVLGVIDVLGIPQEVVAPTDGIVTSVLADNGQAVEYGQALAEIDPLEPMAEADEDLA